jgi:hypothetical protein
VNETPNIGAGSSASPSQSNLSKKQNPTSVPYLEYNVALESCEPGSDRLFDCMFGILKVQDERFANLAGELDFPTLGQVVPISACKISNVPRRSPTDWSYSSENVDLNPSFYYGEVGYGSDGAFYHNILH